MKSAFYVTCSVITGLTGYAVGFAVADGRDETARHVAREENYADRARICIEAAALLRNGDEDAAVAMLEDRALGALRGVPMGRSYSELSGKSQELLVTAKRYQEAVSTADLELDQLTRGVPNDHPRLSKTVRELDRAGASKGVGKG